MNDTVFNWQEFNQKYLSNALAKLRQKIATKLDNDSQRFSDKDTDTLSSLPSSTPALEILCHRFGLSIFEQQLLLLCAGIELDSDWSSFVAQLQGDSRQNYATFALALAILTNPHWNALTPQANLRYWRLLELDPKYSLTSSPLRIDERILHYLLGIEYLDERLIGILQPIKLEGSLVSTHQELANQLQTIWLEMSKFNLPILQLFGKDNTAKKQIACTLCQQLQLSLYTLSAEVIPHDIEQLNLLMRLCEREWLLANKVVLLDFTYLDNTLVDKEQAIARFIHNLNSPLIIATPLPRPPSERLIISFEVNYPTIIEQKQIWQNALESLNINYNEQINFFVSSNNFSSYEIQTFVAELKTKSQQTQGELAKICRRQIRSRLEQIAQRIESKANWDDLVISEKNREIIQEIEAYLRQKIKVYQDWGFASKSKRGLGISAIFAGASGTGKTMAAEVIGNQLNLDVYRIELSSVISKYIGETEKNLQRIFDAAEGSGVILLFDEADALFGKRSEVKDSHDRYANIEVSYLLQRLESYQGLAILTTNLKNAIDQAFLRRIRFVVQFAFPDFQQRLQIWQKIFPVQTPTEDLDFQKLAKLNLAGGNIRNIALNAAFIAADAGEVVKMEHIVKAVKNEYVKLEQPLIHNDIFT